MRRWASFALACAFVLALSVSGQITHIAAASSTLAPVGRITACSNSVARAPSLEAVQTSFVRGLLSPFGVSFSPGGHFLFADSPTSTLASGSDLSVYISDDPSGRLTASATGTFAGTQLLGMSRSPDGRYLAAANGGGAEVFSIPRMEQAGSAPTSWLVGALSSNGLGAIETSFSPNGNYLFVTLEDSSEIAVFDFAKALETGFGSSDLVGYVPLGLSPVGMALSRDGRSLFATSEEYPSASAHRVPGGNALTAGGEGTLSTVNLRDAERDPSRAVVSTVWAGCSPVRVIASRTMVYVTARGSDDLVTFSASRLLSSPSSAQEGVTPVGESPVGLALVDDNRRLVIADSNRFDVNAASSNLAVVSGRSGAIPVLVGYVKAGAFPRDMSVSPDGKTLAVSNYDSGQVEDVILAGLARSLQAHRL